MEPRRDAPLIDLQDPLANEIMKKPCLALTVLSFILIFTLSAQTKTTPSTAKPKTATTITGRLVEIKTDSGTMIVKLYDSTPLHRDNFIKLVKEKFYDSLLFHRRDALRTGPHVRRRPASDEKISS